MPEKRTSSSDHEGEYCLPLSKKQGWHILSHEEVRPWTDLFASIMELSPFKTNTYPKYIFMPTRTGRNSKGELLKRINQEFSLDLPEEGWKIKDLKLTKMWIHEREPDVICEIGERIRYQLDIVRMWQAVFPIYILAKDAGGLPLHAALAEWKNKGFLFAGTGDSGKSTVSRRLPRSWKTLCDDAALILPSLDDQYAAHPFPSWSDHLMRRSEQTWNVVHSTPLKAIFFLEKGKTTEIKPLSGSLSALRIYESALEALSCGWAFLDLQERRIHRKKIFENACRLAVTTPIYTLQTSLSARFWKNIEQMFSKSPIEEVTADKT
jgi:SynChlorMet cassette protein ScmC